MPIDRDRVLGAGFEGLPFSWDEDDLILYGLGIGAGDPPDDPGELKYVYEGRLVAAPTYGTIPPFGLMMGFISLDGVEISLTQVLHGEHTLVVHSPIPSSGTVTQSGQVVDIHDKGKGALIVIEVVSVLESTGAPLFTNRAGIYVRGEGGFGGDPGPSSTPGVPEGEADHVLQTRTLPQQALLYRMASGDRNPLHAEPEFASIAGYERPILHGLCTYGLVAREVVESVLGGDPRSFGSFRARFTGHVFPGETLITRVWTGEGQHLVETWVEERGTRVLSRAVLTESGVSP